VRFQAEHRLVAAHRVVEGHRGHRFRHRPAPSRPRASSISG
jgi:hypothetical protein